MSRVLWKIYKTYEKKLYYASTERRETLESIELKNAKIHPEPQSMFHGFGCIFLLVVK